MSDKLPEAKVKAREFYDEKCKEVVDKRYPGSAWGENERAIFVNGARWQFGQDQIAYDSLELKAQKLVEALEFACAEDMWTSNGKHNEQFKYNYIDWYQDVLRRAIAEYKSEG